MVKKADKMKRAATTVGRDESAKKSRTAPSIPTPSATHQGAAGQGQVPNITSLSVFCDELNNELRSLYPEGSPVRILKVVHQDCAVIQNKDLSNCKLPERHCIWYETYKEDLATEPNRRYETPSTLTHMNWVAYDRSQDHAESVNKNDINSTTADRLRRYVVDFLAPITLLKTTTYDYRSLEPNREEPASIVFGRCDYDPRCFKLEWCIKASYPNSVVGDEMGNTIDGESECTEMMNIIKKASWPDLFQYLELQDSIEDDIGWQGNVGDNISQAPQSIFNRNQGNVGDNISQALQSIFNRNQGMTPVDGEDLTRALKL